MPILVNPSELTSTDVSKLTDGQTWGEWTITEKDLTLQHRAPQAFYEIDLETIRDSAEMLDWIFQVQMKTWASHEVTGSLLDALHAIFDPQATVCSYGTDHPKADVGTFLRGRFRHIDS